MDGRVVPRGVLQEEGSLESVVGSSSLGVVEKEQVVEMEREGYELIRSFNNWGEIISLLLLGLSWTFLVWREGVGICLLGLSVSPVRI